MAEEENTLKRGLSSRHVEMIALGGTIGTGLFLGAGRSISTAGPAILLVYIVVGLFMFWMMRALGELIISNPEESTFVGFVTKYLGERAGFVIGWTYWIGWITIAMAELTAVGLYMQYWFPNIHAWVFELIVLILLYLINIIAVRAFGETEFWFAMIKIVAIVAMIVAGVIMIFGQVKTSAGTTSIANLWQYGFVAHHGTKILSAFQMVFFAFLGIEFVGMTASEAKDPLKTIPKAVNSIIIRILIFYVGALIAIMSIQPWTNYNANESPFVQVFSGIGISAAAGVINFVVLTAAASSLNSGLFTTGRMLFALTGPNTWVGKLNHRFIPIRGLNISTVMVGMAIVLNFIFPSDAFDKITSIASAAFVVIYMTLIYAHVKFRKSADYHVSPSHFKMPLAPFSNYLTIAFMTMILLILLVGDGTRATTILALAWYAVMIVISMRKKNK
ncbi:MAG: amino acid permease [Lactobacillaceae bacterium]|nr:amino acid permease [Lactobacillaceae bacterium]